MPNNAFPAACAAIHSTLNTMLDDVLTSAEQRCYDVKAMDRSVRLWCERKCARATCVLTGSFVCALAHVGPQVVERIAGAASGNELDG